MELRFLAIFQEILIPPTMKTIPVGRKWVHFFFWGGGRPWNFLSQTTVVLWKCGMKYMEGVVGKATHNHCGIIIQKDHSVNQR